MRSSLLTLTVLLLSLITNAPLARGESFTSREPLVCAVYTSTIDGQTLGLRLYQEFDGSYRATVNSINIVNDQVVGFNEVAIKDVRLKKHTMCGGLIYYGGPELLIYPDDVDVEYQVNDPYGLSYLDFESGNFSGRLKIADDRAGYCH